MANPYGIEQVDVPGLLSAYDAGRQRRVEMMLRQRMMEREDLQLEREHALHNAYAKIRPPGSGGTAAVNAYGAASTPPPSPADAATAPSAASVGPSAPATAPVAAATAPVTAPTLPGGPPAPGTVPATWSEANQGVIGQMMAIDPEHAAQLSTTFRQMDDAQLAQVKRRNDAIAHVALGLKALPEAERAAELQRRAQTDLIPYGVDPASLTRADLSDRGLDQHIGEARDIEAIIKDAKPDLMAVSPGTPIIDRNHPEKGAVYTAPTEHKYEHVVMPNGDALTFDPATGTWIRAVEGAPAGGTPAGGASPAPTGGHTGGGHYNTSTAGVVANGRLEPIAFFNNVMAHYEGGYNPHDLNGSPVNHGINGGANPGVNIKELTVDQAAQIFAKKYFGPSGAANLPPALAAVHADTYFMNETKAKQFLAQANGDPQKYMDLREAWMRRLEARHPEVATAWDTRNADLRSVAQQLSGGGAAASGGPAPQSGRPINGAKPADPVISDEAASLAAAVYRTKGTLPAGVGRTKGDVDKIMGVAAHMSMADAHRIADETVSTWQDTRAAQDTLVAFSKGKQADQTRSLNVAIHHIDLVRQAADALQNGNIQLFNSVAQHIAQATGHPAPTNFDALKQFVFDEVTKGAIGNSGAVSDRQEAGRSASRASSPQQLAGVLDRYQTLLGGQAKGLQRQYEAGTGRHDYADKYLEPRTRQILLGHGGGQQQHLPTLTPAQYRAAPSGTRFLTTDGRPMRKP
jgi:hypothetical protein